MKQSRMITKGSITSLLTGLASGLMAGLTLATPIHTHATVILNEIDYDQPGVDTAEFIELYNPSSSSISLNGYSLDLVNGNNNSVYRSIDLTGFNIGSSSYFVVCSDTSLIANCNYDFTNSNGWFQNGAPDAVALYNTTELIDSLSYEGDMIGFTEGSVLTLADSNSEIMSISRLPDGYDSDNNNFDFQAGCITPGLKNISGSGDCSTMSSVAEPSTALLVGSGLIGLIGFARRKTS